MHTCMCTDFELHESGGGVTAEERTSTRARANSNSSSNTNVRGKRPGVTNEVCVCVQAQNKDSINNKEKRENERAPKGHTHTRRRRWTHFLFSPIVLRFEGCERLRAPLATHHRGCHSEGVRRLSQISFPLCVRVRDQLSPTRPVHLSLFPRSLYTCVCARLRVSFFFSLRH